MELHKLLKIQGNTKKSKRIGRGRGSGKGDHTVGKGIKGQKSRAGARIPRGFEGGQTPLYKRLPQIGGFKNPTSKKIRTVPLSKLTIFDEDTVVTPQMLLDRKVIRKIPKHGVKILGNGKLSKKLNFKGFLLSKTAQGKIEKLGGKVSDV